MLRQQIIDALAAGQKCYWINRAYQVILSGDELRIVCSINGSVQYLDDSYLKDVFAV